MSHAAGLPRPALPSISALMVTRGRPALARQSIECFAAQAYPRRELVVLTDRAADRDELAGWVEHRGIEAVRFVHHDGPDLPLGALRNRALEAARGDLLAQWDDDDLHHPLRLLAQVRALLDAGAAACFLSEQLQYFAATRDLFLIDWRHRRADLEGVEPGWDCIPGTAVFRREAAPRYPEIARHEDADALRQLLASGPVARLAGAGHLYVYRHHGANTFPHDHFRSITRWAATRAAWEERRDALGAALTFFAPFLGPGPLEIRHRDGGDERRGRSCEPEPRAPFADRGAAPVDRAATGEAASNPAAAAPTHPPSLTVAIATWNRAALLREALAALAVMRRPSGLDWEVLVCDNGSTDDTSSAVGEFEGLLPVRRLVETQPAKSRALRRLLLEARGDWVLFVDDDVRVAPGWLEAYLEAIARHPEAGCLGGPVLPWLERRPRPLEAWFLRLYPWMCAIVTFDREETIDPAAVRFVHGANIAVRRDAVNPEADIDGRLGMFGPLRISGEDLALAARVMARGHSGWRVPGAAVAHYIPRRRIGARWFFARWLGEARAAAIDGGADPLRRLALARFATPILVRETARAGAHAWRAARSRWQARRRDWVA